MSASQLSDTVLKQLINRISKAYEAESGPIADMLKTAKENKDFKKFGAIPLSGKGTRLLTDPRQLGIVTQQGLNNLASEFNEAISSPATILVSKDYETIAKSPKATPAFKQYMASKSIAGIDFTLAVKPLAEGAARVFNDRALYGNFFNYLRTEKNILPVLDNNFTAYTLPEAQHAVLNNHFEKYLISKGTDPILVEFIGFNTDAGHLLGIFNQRLTRALGLEANLVSISGDPHPARVSTKRYTYEGTEEDQKAGAKLDQIFEDMLQLITNVDVLKSGLLTNIDLIISTSKTIYGESRAGDMGVTAVEIGMSAINQIAGNQISSAGINLTKLVDRAKLESAKPAGSRLDVNRRPGESNPQGGANYDAANHLEDLFANIAKLATYITNMSAQIEASVKDEGSKALVQLLIKDSQRIGESLIQSKGSDSMLDAARNTLVAILSGKGRPSKQVTTVQNRAKLGKKSTKTKLQTPKVKRTKSTSSSKPFTPSSIRVPSQVASRPKAPNLISLQNLINQGLAKQIQSNMGTGNSTKVLNYRTGRFAESAKVERMSESRQGMITAFYSYMRNPYGTFAEGGAQEFPVSRNPKLLIAQSIRQLAGAQVANRMRAVLV